MALAALVYYVIILQERDGGGGGVGKRCATLARVRVATLAAAGKIHIDLGTPVASCCQCSCRVAWRSILVQWVCRDTERGLEMRAACIKCSCVLLPMFAKSIPLRSSCCGACSGLYSCHA